MIGTGSSRNTSAMHSDYIRRFCYGCD